MALPVVGSRWLVSDVPQNELRTWLNSFSDKKNNTCTEFAKMYKKAFEKIAKLILVIWPSKNNRSP